MFKYAWAKVGIFAALLIVVAAVLISQLAAPKSAPKVTAKSFTAAAKSQIKGSTPQVTVARAIEKIGLDAIQKRNPKVSAKTIANLAQDKTAHVDASGAIYFADAPASVPFNLHKEAEDDQLYAAGIDLDQAFSLQSRPGSKHTIFLDFNSYRVENTAWNGNFGLSASATDTIAYDLDGDPTTFNSDERSLIISVWLQVSQTYSPFDVNVTTVNLGDDAINRSDWVDQTYGSHVVFNRSQEFSNLCSCGGIAHLNAFDQPYSHHNFEPTWVVGLSIDPFWLAGAAEHEVGHNLGLSHDDTPNQEYYPGTDVWGPIMGGGGDRIVDQWNNGDYPLASNQEDDIAIIAQHGPELIPDDFGDTPSAASNLVGTEVDVQGLISTRGDVDMFGFDTKGGTISISATGAPGNRTLDIGLEIVNENGVIVAQDQPSMQVSFDPTWHSWDFSGLDAKIVAELPAGHYEIVVDGVGQGDSSTGYSDYGSLGKYELFGTVPNGQGQLPAVESVSPSQAAPGVAVTLTGVSLDSTLAVTLNGVSCPFTIQSSTQILVTIPPFVSTGRFKVEAIYGATFALQKVAILQATTGAVEIHFDKPELSVGDTADINVQSWAPGTSFKFQWYRDGQPIPGGIFSTFKPGGLLVGETLSVVVKAFRFGFNTVIVASSNQVPVHGNFFEPTLLPSIQGSSFSVGATLTATPPEVYPTPEKVVYNWYCVDSDWAETLLQTSDSDTLTLTAPMAGCNIKVKASVSRKFLQTMEVSGRLAGLVTGGVFHLGSAQVVSDSGTTNVGDALHVSLSGWVPMPTTLYVAWFRDGAMVDPYGDLGLNRPTYTLTDQDAGHTLTAVVGGAKLGFSNASMHGSNSISVPRLVFDLPDIRLKYSNAVVGQSLAFEAASHANLASQVLDPTWVQIDWLRDGADVNQHGATYTLTRSDLGASLSVKLTVVKPGYVGQQKLANASTRVSSDVGLAGSVTVDGILAQNYPVNAAMHPLDIWPTSRSFKWECVVNDGVNPAKTRTLATTDSYSFVKADIGCQVRVTATVSAENYPTSVWVSDLSQPVGAFPWNLDPPSIRGSATVGSTLVAVQGAVRSPTVLNRWFEWSRDDVKVGAGNTYQLTANDLGHTITLREFLEAGIYGSMNSGVSLTVLQAQPSLGALTITGEAKIGSQLKVAVPEWTKQAGVQLSYHWMRGAIQVGVQSTYFVAPNDVGSSLSVRVEAIRTGYATVESQSPPTSKVAQNKTTPGDLLITGRLKVGSTLTVSAIGGTSGASLSYAWSRNGVAIAGAKGKAYKLTAKDRGAKLTVAVTAVKAGYKSSTAKLALPKVG